MLSKKLALSFGAAALLLLSTASSAFAVTCTERIAAVQTENGGKLLVRFQNDTWHVIAADTTPARADRLSVVMAAFLSGKSLRIAYTGSTCSAHDYGTVPVSIRIGD